MRKIKLFVLLGIMVVLVGCSASTEKSNEIFKALKKQNIINKNYKFKENYTEKEYSTEWLTTNDYYVYENNNEKITITYKKNSNSKINCDYVVKISDVIKENEIREDDCFTNADTICYYYGDKISKISKYELDNEKKYCINEFDGIFVKKFEITNAK